MSYFLDWEKLCVKSIDEKKVYFNNELKKMLDEMISNKNVDFYGDVRVDKSEDFRLDLKLKGGEGKEYLDILLCNPTGKVLYWAIYDYKCQVLKPQQDSLYIEYLMSNIDQISPLLIKNLKRVA